MPKKVASNPAPSVASTNSSRLVCRQSLVGDSGPVPVNRMSKSPSPSASNTAAPPVTPYSSRNAPSLGISTAGPNSWILSHPGESTARGSSGAQAVRSPKKRIVDDRIESMVTLPKHVDCSDWTGSECPITAKNRVLIKIQMAQGSMRRSKRTIELPEIWLLPYRQGIPYV